jgi:dTDP-4-amino-4,6-dideoxygalactose transaminase
MTVATSRRDALQEFLRGQGVGSAVHYPSALHQQKAMAELLPVPPSLPRAEQAGREVLCLPMFPELEVSEVARACEAVRLFFAGAAGDAGGHRVVDRGGPGGSGPT